MTLHEFPRLGERYWEQRLENGLLLRVVPKPGFARSYAKTDKGNARPSHPGPKPGKPAHKRKFKHQ